uniref:Uncharacterized protein n=1 Tax=Musca domestica TaxID=7370 RepID=A0A1I8N6X3_MUSDO
MQSSSIKLVERVAVLLFVLLMATSHLPCIEMSSDDDGPLEENGRVVYDQRQSGKYNIHVVIKDVAIIEMGQNEFQDNSYSDEDYYYDENDLTVRPITLNPPTAAMTTTKLSTTSTVNKENNFTALSVDGVTGNSSRPHIEQNTSASFNKIQEHDETTINSNVLWNTLTSLISGKPLADNEVTTLKPDMYPTSKTTVPNIEVKPRSKIEPIFAQDDSPKFRDDAIPLRNSKIYKLKIHRSHQPFARPSKKSQARRCRSNQSKNVNGHCGNKRSTSGSLL